MKNFIYLLIHLFSLLNIRAQWQVQTSGITEDLNDIAILNQSNAVVVGDNGTILKSTDNGTNWNVKSSGTANHLNAVSFRDEQNGIVVGNEVICRTTDGGENWLVSSLNKNGITISYRLRLNNSVSSILIGCNDGTIISSNDNGNTWDDTTFSSEPVIAVDFNFSWQFDLAYAATRSYTASTVFPSNLWQLYSNPLNIEDDLTGGDLRNWFQYLIGSGGFSGMSPLFLKKRWVDTAWVMQYSFVPPPYIPLDITSQGDILYVCGSDGKIFNSTNGGNDWSEQLTGTINTLNSINFRYDSIGYSVGVNGTILFTDNGGVTSVEKMVELSSYHLYQNYPNPFNPSTTIEFTIAETGYISLVVYNILGKENVTILEEGKFAGEHRVEFDASGLSSGIYFYRLTTKDFTQTKKMLFIR